MNIATASSHQQPDGPSLGDYPNLNKPWYNIPDFIGHAMTQGRRAILFPDGLAKNLYEHTEIETLKDGTSVCCLGQVYQYDGEKYFEPVYAIERRPDKIIFLLTEPEFQELRSLSEVDRVEANLTEWVEQRNFEIKSGQRF